MTSAQISQFLADLYSQGIRDDRISPEPLREGQFRAGWRNYLKGREYGDQAMNRIAWNSLGYRLAKHLGVEDETLLEETLAVTLSQWKQGHPQGR